MEEKVKKIFEEPTVQKVEFDFKTRIAASSCGCGDAGRIPDCDVQ